MILFAEPEEDLRLAVKIFLKSRGILIETASVIGEDAAAYGLIIYSDKNAVCPRGVKSIFLRKPYTAEDLLKIVSVS